MSGWSSSLYRPLPYSVHEFRTVVFSVRVIPLLSSKTADLCCWVLVRACGCCRPPCCFLASFPSLYSCTATQSTFPTLPSSSSWHQCSLFCTLLLLRSLRTSCCLSCRLWSHRSRTSFVTQVWIFFLCLPRLLRLLRVGLLLECSRECLYCCPLSTCFSLENFRYFRAKKHSTNICVDRRRPHSAACQGCPEHYLLHNTNWIRSETFIPYTEAISRAMVVLATKKEQQQQNRSTSN